MIIANRAPPRRPLVSVTAPASSTQVRIAFNADLVRQESLQDVRWMSIDDKHQRLTFISTPSREYQGPDDGYPLMPDGGQKKLSKTAGKVLYVPKDQFSMLARQAPRRYEPEIRPGRAGPEISINLGPAPAADSERVHRAYRDLDLHPVIAEAANKLYLDGHYANAIEAAIKALCGLVRLHSGKDLDGADLMKTVFSPKNPILRFNDFRDRSDRDEQEGFMMMFAGAVAGLRNPRAHKIIKDYPERALEYIAYISLLAKLLDGARKV